MKRKLIAQVMLTNARKFTRRSTGDNISVFAEVKLRLVISLTFVSQLSVTCVFHTLNRIDSLFNS